MKTKIGVPAGVLGAALYLSGLVSGYVVLFLLAGYVLLFEENQWLRYVAVKAVWISLGLFVLSAALGLIPDFLGFIESIALVFRGSFSYNVIERIVNVLQNAIGLIRVGLLLLLGIKALKQGDVRLGRLDTKIQSILFQ